MNEPATPTAPYRRAALPPFPGYWVALGPGVVWMALAQGSGELIWWPYLVAKYQLGFLFLLLPACLLQWPLTMEIGRYTTLTGESIWQGFIRLHKAFALPLWLLMLMSFLWFGAFASSGGTALAALTQFPSGWTVRGQSLFWAYLTIFAFVAALVISPVIYRLIEKLMIVVAVVTIAGLVIACTHPSVVKVLPEFLTGLWSPQWPLPRPWDPKDAKPLLTGITFAGLGGFWTLFYSYWLREKGAGMARDMGHLTGLLGRKEELQRVGAVPLEVPEGPVRLRAWERFLWADSAIGIFGNILTTLMTCLLAYVMLAPKGVLPEGWDIAVVQSRFFEARGGAVGKALFLFVAAAFLADTWLSTADSVSRVNTDILHSFFPKTRARSPRFWYFVSFGLLTSVTCITMPLAQPGPLILLMAVTGFVGTVVFSFGVLALNYWYLPRHLPAYARPKFWTGVLLFLTCLTYLALATGYIWLETTG